jgi:hypothetical protein
VAVNEVHRVCIFHGEFFFRGPFTSFHDRKKYAYANHWFVISAVTIHIAAAACDLLFDITMKFVEITPPQVKDVPVLMTA